MFKCNIPLFIPFISILLPGFIILKDDSLARANTDEDLMLTSQAQWSVLNSKEDLPCFFRIAGGREIIFHSPPVLMDKVDDEIHIEEHYQNQELLGKIRESSMPNRIRKPVFLLQ